MKQKYSVHLVICMSFAVLLILLFSSFASSSFSTGNLSSSINSQYSANDNLKGWINISLANEPFNSIISFYNSNITLKDLLEKNKAQPGNYNCTSDDCGMVYETIGAGAASKNLTISEGQSALIGMIIEDSDVEVKNMTLSITSNAPASCLSQLKMDLFNDEEYDWTASKKSADYCAENYGCYSDSSSTTLMEASKKYCSTIFVNPAPGLKVGAKISGSGSAAFAFSVNFLNSDNYDAEELCEGNASAGTASCDINSSITLAQNITICVMQTSGDYSIYYEDNQPVCGEVYDDSGGQFSHDFSIFAKPAKYSALGSATYSASEKDIELLNSQCSNGCIIPIRFNSGYSGQQIRINSADIKYESQGISKHSSSLFDLTTAPSKISMGFRKLVLDNANLKVPSSPGKYNISLMLGNVQIAKPGIQVLSLPTIESVFPLEAPASAEIKFIAVISGINATGFEWDFGDNTSVVETTKNYAVHKFSGLRAYTLKLTAKNANGEVSKNFVISVVSPKAYLNSTLAEYKRRIASIKAASSSMPAAVQSYVDKKYSLQNTEIKIQELQVAFNSAGDDTPKYIEILESLSSINLPYSINATKKTSGKFIIDKSKISLEDLKAITAETAEASEDSIRNAIFEWNRNSLDITGTLQVYTAREGNASIPLASYMNLKITPKKTLGQIYGVIKAPKSILEISNPSSGVSYSESAAGFSLDMSSEKNIEFAIGHEVGFFDAPIYFSPKISELSADFQIATCNHNQECESSLGENWKNCRPDCKPWGWALLWIIISLIIVFILYIIAQEWYKRKYEDYLFKEKNDLFNLVHFMDNAEKNGLKKEEIISKLKEKIWAGEQIIYAYKKYKGERTGMWEIPVLKFLENRKISKEISKRNIIGVSGLPPRPIRPFTGGKPTIAKVISGNPAPNSKPAQIQQQNNSQKK